MVDIIPRIGHRVKILFNSCSHIPVRSHIADVVEIALDSQYLEKDITAYVRDSIPGLVKINLPIDLYDEIQKLLIDGANRMFL
jgi:hypothetical protein